MGDTTQALDRVVGANRWTRRDEQEPGTAKQLKAVLQRLAKLAAPALDAAVIEVTDVRSDRTTMFCLGEANHLVEGEKEDGLDDELIAGLSALLREAGSDARFARAGDAIACVTPAQVAALAAAGVTAVVLEPDGDDADEGLADGYRRPTLADVPGEDVVIKKPRPGGPARERKVKGPMAIGPVTVTGGATVSFDAADRVDQVVATKGALKLDAGLAGRTLSLGLRGRAEFRDRSWRAWGELAADLAWDDNAIHAGDEIDVLDGHVAGLVLAAAGTIGGKKKAAGAVVDVDRLKRA